MAEILESQQLAQSKCQSCEGGVPPVDPETAARQVEKLAGWQLSDDGKHISRRFDCTSFLGALDLANRIGDLAEAEGHHPDIHLTGYRHLQVVLTTHAIQALSPNDFILAAKIDQLSANC